MSSHITFESLIQEHVATYLVHCYSPLYVVPAVLSIVYKLLSNAPKSRSRSSCSVRNYHPISLLSNYLRYSNTLVMIK